MTNPVEQFARIGADGHALRGPQSKLLDRCLAYNFRVVVLWPHTLIPFSCLEDPKLTLGGEPDPSAAYGARLHVLSTNQATHPVHVRGPVRSNCLVSVRSMWPGEGARAE